MSIKNQAIRGVVFNWLGRGCSLIIVFFLTPFLLHTLQEVKYGVWSTVMAFTGYYSLADMGLRGAGTKYVAQFHSVNDLESINKVVVTSLAVYAVMGMLVAVVVGLVAWLFPLWFPTDISETEFRTVILLSGSTIVLRMLAQIFNASLSALQRHDISNAVAVVSQLASAGGIVACLLAGGGLVGMGLVTLGVAVFSQSVRVFFAMRLLPGLSLLPRHFDRTTLKLVFKFGGATTLPRATRQIVQNLANPLIFAMLGPSAVAVYDVPERILRKVSGLGRSFTTVIMPLASRLDAKGNQKALVNVTRSSARVLLALSSSMAVVLICFGKQIIDLWIDPVQLSSGAAFGATAYPILCVLGLASVLRISSMTMRSVLRGTARFRALISIAAVEVTLVLVLAPILLSWIGLIGMAYAILLSQAIAGGVLIPFATCRVLECPIFGFTKSIVPRALASTTITACVAVTIASAWQPRHMYELLLQLAVVVGCACLAAFFVCLSAERRADVYAALIPSSARGTQILKQESKSTTGDH